MELLEEWGNNVADEPPAPGHPSGENSVRPGGSIRLVRQRRRAHREPYLGARTEASALRAVPGVPGGLSDLSSLGDGWAGGSSATLGGVVTTIAGVARFEPRQARIPFADGQASEARFTYPRGLAVDSAGIIYVADTWNGAVRKLTPEGAAWRVTTIAGHGAPVREALTR